MIGGGPAGLIAAETLSARGARVTVYERMPSLGRKLLMAGRGGLNLTHSEPLDRFMARYGAADRIPPLIEAFPPRALVEWAESLGQPTFVGTSGRVFPKAMKASPLLRAWLRRLEGQGVSFRTRAEWRGWDEAGALRVEGLPPVRPDATILALGGASWPKLGSDGSWASILAERGVDLAPFRPANVGFKVAWSPLFAERFAGTPLKPLALSFEGRTVRGEAVVSGYGLEGGAIYALGAPLRDAIERDGKAVLKLDLAPDLGGDTLAARLARPRGGQSTSTFLRKAAGLTPVVIGLLREAFGGALPDDLAAAIKAAPVTLTAPRGLERAISTAGGVAWSAVDEHLMLKAIPNVFVAGEMLDWEAPTGGYLLQACFASGVAAAEGCADRARSRLSANPRGSISPGP
ncbi:MAG: TIGR03862 family flavoprotein [Caulobacterales bacterium]|nr:TIGR03862 family flavoprotein [Caulobacterales bacterium]